MRDHSSYAVRDVFTPTRPARIAFVEREEVNDKLVNALRTPGKQLVVYGHSGTGKTTLLVNKLHQLYEYHITTRCMKGLKFEQLLLDAFDQLEPFYTSDVTSSRKTTAAIELGSSYRTLSAKIARTNTMEAGTRSVRVLPPQLTPQTLGKFLGAVKACWVLEDFHKIDVSEKIRLSQLMKVFMDMSDEFTDLKIVALGAVDTARQVVEYDDEMRNRIAEISVPLMSSEEITAIIRKGEEALNVSFSPNIVKVISRHSNGLASVCHHLCLNMCDAAGINDTVVGAAYQFTSANCQEAVKAYVNEASDSIKSAFDKALKPRRNGVNNAELILKALSAAKEDGAARFDILKRVRQEIPNYQDQRLKHNLNKLCEPSYGSVLRYEANSSRYAFSDPIYRAYALALYHPAAPVPSRIPNEVDLDQFEKMLTSLLQDKLKVHFRIAREKGTEAANPK